MPRETRPDRIRIRSALTLSLCLAAAALAGGCSSFGLDDVELQGGVFDALGMSGSSNSKKLADVKVEPRPALVLPPSPENLPPPGDRPTAAAQPEAWPVDPEDRRAQAKADLDKRHREYCERAIQNARMRNESGVIMGPKGNCQPGLFGNLGDIVSGKQQQEQQKQ